MGVSKSDADIAGATGMEGNFIRKAISSSSDLDLNNLFGSGRNMATPRIITCQVTKPMLHPRITYNTKENVAIEVLILDEDVTIGRHVDSKIYLPDEIISKMHAVISKTDQGVFIKDYDAATGVAINNKLIKRDQLVAIQDNDVIVIGPYRLFVHDGPMLTKDRLLNVLSSPKGQHSFLAAKSISSSSLFRTFSSKHKLSSPISAIKSINKSISIISLACSEKKDVITSRVLDLSNSRLKEQPSSFSSKDAAYMTISVEGDTKEIDFAIESDDITIGRSEENMICLSDENVSKFHAVLTKVNGVFFITDKGSTTRVWLDFKRIHPNLAVRLYDTNLFSISQFNFKLRHEGSTKSSSKDLRFLQSVTLSESIKDNLVIHKWSGSIHPNIFSELAAELVNQLNKSLVGIFLENSNGTKMNFAGLLTNAYPPPHALKDFTAFLMKSDRVLDFLHEIAAFNQQSGILFTAESLNVPFYRFSVSDQILAEPSKPANTKNSVYATLMNNLETLKVEMVERYIGLRDPLDLVFSHKAIESVAIGAVLASLNPIMFQRVIEDTYANYIESFFPSFLSRGKNIRDDSITIYQVLEDSLSSPHTYDELSVYMGQLRLKNVLEFMKEIQAYIVVSTPLFSCSSALEPEKPTSMKNSVFASTIAQLEDMKTAIISKYFCNASKNEVALPDATMQKIEKETKELLVHPNIFALAFNQIRNSVMKKYFMDFLGGMNQKDRLPILFIDVLDDLLPAPFNFGAFRTYLALYNVEKNLDFLKDIRKYQFLSITVFDPETLVDPCGEDDEVAIDVMKPYADARKPADMKNSAFAARLVELEKNRDAICLTYLVHTSSIKKDLSPAELSIAVYGSVSTIGPKTLASTNGSDPGYIARLDSNLKAKITMLTDSDEEGPSPEVTLELDETTFGRREDNIIVLRHADVSGYHAVISKVGGSYFITDKESSNRVFINGKKIKPNKCTAIYDGDKLKIGPFKILFNDANNIRIATTTAGSSFEIND